ncbi:hypothetical protein NEMBOFW57_008324 [Staphylotrichum longicolle]|uniref:CN hydrolase domain-containing protein n=1 Tax=Staphylotrichum longicolle TaxID=669026 RepID=A0AAD4ERF4_9PEZI|nr:hypothetical protein NEMBOFW57_008324 [Staphylotrichum longicolle]
MAPFYKIAIIQLQPKDVAIADNYARAESFIRKAAAEGAHLAILPEYHLTSLHPRLRRVATYLPRYQALARELSINIVPGTITEVHSAPKRDDSEGDSQDREIRNMAYWLSPEGAILASYQKANLWHSERPHLTAGVSHAPHRAFDTPLAWPDGRPIRAGMLICWDLAFPEAFRALLRDGAELVVIPSFWLLDGSDLDEDRKGMNKECEGLFIDSVMVARAFENECVVVLCNKGGLSQAVVPVYGPVAGLGWGSMRRS